MKNVFQIFVIILVLAIIVYSIIPKSYNINDNYVRKIIVNDSSKVEWAISNAVNDVQSRNFIVKTLQVKYNWVISSYVIICGGINRECLLMK